MTPLILLVGFLGAGKTSLLRALVGELLQRGAVPSVILNDYQNARVDAEFFRNLQAAVTPISGSCVCCGSRAELLDALDAYEHRPRGVVFLESNGTTDAEELVTALAADPKLRRFSLPFQISVVDCKRWQKRFWHNGLEADQLKTASCIFLGHRDGCEVQRQEVVREAIVRRNPGASFAEVEDLIGGILSMEEAMRGKENRPLPCKCCCGHHKHSEEHCPAEHHKHHHDTSLHHFAAIEIALPERVAVEKFRRALQEMPKEILRAKGLVRLQEEPEELQIFQKIDQFDEVQIVPVGGECVLPSPLAVFVGTRIPASFADNFIARILE